MARQESRGKAGICESIGGSARRQGSRPAICQHVLVHSNKISFAHEYVAQLGNCFAKAVLAFVNPLQASLA